MSTNADDVTPPRTPDLHALVHAEIEDYKEAVYQHGSLPDALQAVVDLHYIIWRDIGWLEHVDGERDEAYAELPVCGHCVPRHSHFSSRAEVPEGPCATIQAIARELGLKTGSPRPNG